MNEADSELIASHFAQAGIETAESERDADVFVLNTCTVRQHAEDKALSLIGRLKRWKEEKKGRKIFVVGCAVERIGEKNMTKKFPFLDAVIGAKSIGKLGEEIKKTCGKTEKSEKKEHKNIVFEKRPFSQYLTIMRGCSMNCAYCVVPSVRGKAEHRPLEEIIEEARRKVASGARELVLLGQTVNSYCWTENGRKTDFTDLLKILSEIDKLKRIRFMSPHPLFFNDEFFKEFEKNKKIASHIHLPAQSGSDRILKIMKRGYTRKRYLDTLAKIKKTRQDSAVSTDFIVGFPDETKKDFEETLKLAQEGEFSLAFCFKYSARHCKESENIIPEKEKEERLNLLLETVKQASKRIFNSRIGKIEDVLLETENYGRSSANFKVRIDKHVAPGEMIKVGIEGVSKNILLGKVLK